MSTLNTVTELQEVSVSARARWQPQFTVLDAQAQSWKYHLYNFGQHIESYRKTLNLKCEEPTVPLLDKQIIGENLPSRLENGTYKGIQDTDVYSKMFGLLLQFVVRLGDVST